MNTATQLSGKELDIAVALAMGATKEKTAPENVIACGYPLHYRWTMFALVNAASIAIAWRPTVDWEQGGLLLELLIENGYVLMHAQGEPFTLLKSAKRIDGATVLEATCRAVVDMFAEKDPA